MALSFKFKAYDETLIDDAVVETERNQQLTVYQLPNYHVLFAIPTDMYEAFFKCAAQFLNEQQQQELLMALGAVESTTIQNQEYLDFMQEQEDSRKAA